MKWRNFLFLTAALPVTAAPVKPAVGEYVAIVRIKKPWYAPKFYVKKKMQDSIPEYQAAPGLTAKYYTFGEEGTFGGIYLWRDASAVSAWFTPAWVEERRKKYNHPGLTVPFYRVVQVSEHRPVAAVEQSAMVAVMAPGFTARDDAEARAMVIESSAGKTAPRLRSYLVELSARQYAEIILYANEDIAPAGVGERFSVPIVIINPK